MLDGCPHRDISLPGGIVKDGTLVCPGHFWRFDLSTGARTDRSERPATVYPTRVRDGWVEARLPAPAPPLSMREWLLAEAHRRGPALADPPPRRPVPGSATPSRWTASGRTTTTKDRDRRWCSSTAPDPG